MKKALTGILPLLLISFSSFAQSKDPCKWVSYNNDPAFNKKVALEIKRVMDNQKNPVDIEHKNGTYLKHVLIYKPNDWDVQRDELGNITYRSQIVSFLYKDKKGDCRRAEITIAETYMGGGKYGELGSDESGISGDGVIGPAKVDCGCVDKIKDWLGDGTGSNASSNNTTTNNPKVIPTDNKDVGDSKSNTSGINNTNVSFSAPININKVPAFDKSKTGYFETKNAAGIITSCGYKTGGKIDGEYRSFNDEGKLEWIYHYKNGNKEGGVAQYDSEGNLKKEGAYKNSQKDGTWNYYSEGKLTSREVYVNGILQK